MEVYITTEKVTVEDIGQNFKMNNRSFLRILQEAANRASSSVGHGISDIETTKTSWVLLYWRVKIFNRAKYNDELTIKTWASFSKKIYSIRSFEIYLKDELIAIADSKWVYVDSISHSILKIPDDLINKYGNNDKKVFNEEFKEKIKLPENIDKSYTYTTMKRDLDANHHVNNIAFLDIASEVIPNDKLNNAKELCVIYKKEITHGDTISCYYLDDTVYLYNEDKKILHGAIILK